jgi:cyclin-dependent kinase 12/13
MLDHKNVVKLKEIVTADGDDDDGDDLKEGGGIYMVFEFMDHDLTGLSESNQVIYYYYCYFFVLKENLS